MPSGPSPKKEYGLTHETFGRFLLWLSSDRERAAEMYLELRRKLVKSFVRRGCAHSEDLADKTLDRAALIVSTEPEKYSSPIALCCGVAKLVWFEYLREVTPEALEPEDVPSPECEDSDFGEAEANCLASCLNQLPGRERELITEYHRARGREKIETRKRLADAYGGLNKLRIAAYRIRCRLHDCITGCVRRVALN